MYRPLKTLSIMTLFVFAVSSFVNTNNVSGHGEAVMECETPTQTLTISTKDGSKSAFDQDELKVTKGTCVMIIFKNTQMVEHDFTLERADGSEWTHLHLIDTLDNSSGPTPGTRITHVQMPDEDKTFDFYCTITGHRGDGMEGKLVVGEGSSESDSPAFGFWLSFTAFLSLVAAVPKIRKS